MNTQIKRTNFPELVNDLNAGVFTEQINHAMSAVAQQVVETGKKGKLVLTFDFSRIGESSQVNVKHRLNSRQPTKRGHIAEEYGTETPLHVGANGTLSLFAEDQLGLDFNREHDRARPSTKPERAN